MTTPPPSERLHALADTLWAERHLVELLLFKLVTAKLLLAADERRFVTLALDEVGRVLDSLHEAEQRREEAVADVAAEWGVRTDELTLTELARRAPEPLRTVFADHATAFLDLANEIDETASTNRRLATATLSHVHASLDALTGDSSTTTYTADGRHGATTAAPLRLDRVL
ncbi:MAG TPA: flagellar protein FlgN [Egibacteraceae bacterium]